MGEMNEWRRKGEGINPYVEIERKRCRGDDGRSEGEAEDEEVLGPQLDNETSSEEGMDYFVGNVSSS